MPPKVELKGPKVKCPKCQSTHPQLMRLGWPKKGLCRYALARYKCSCGNVFDLKINVGN